MWLKYNYRCAGKYVAISGIKARRRANPPKIKKKGKEAFAIVLIGSPVKFFTTNKLKPTGGVICAISTDMTRKIANQTGS